MQIAGFEVIRLTETTSTNDEALQLSRDKSGQSLVIKAQRQIKGRGRRGRVWQSLDGNLFFSVLLEFPLKDLGTLVMAAALGLLQTIKQYKPTADVRLKWPNDVLLNGAKVSGMLLEKGDGEYMIVGIGVNIMQSPQNEEMLYPATSLKAAGINTTADDFLQKYLPILAENIRRKATNLQQEWMKNAKGTGERILVRQNDKEICGTFCGIDENADLLLQTASGVQKILAGDVFYEGEK
jgi:BirA family biotin operon repressor/biotin-[acetyl-CoA-carboxylase] ligase